MITTIPVSPRQLELAVSAAQQLRALLGEDAEDELLLVSTIDGETRLLDYVDRITVRILEVRALIPLAEARLAGLRHHNDVLAGTLQQILQALELTRLERVPAVLRLQANPPSVAIVDQALLPAELMRQPPIPAPEPDKRGIAERLKAGETVPGAGWAPPSKHLRIAQR